MQVDPYLLPQAAFPSGGLSFKNESRVRQTKGMHVIVHNSNDGGFGNDNTLFDTSIS